MHLATTKSILALLLTTIVFAVAVILRRRRSTFATTLLAFGTAFFIIVAFAHVFEALTLLPAFGWGRPHSAGHYIDLTAAVLGIILVIAGLIAAWAERRRR